MFEKCINCDRIGNDCVPNLLQLPFHELLIWLDKKQKALGWTNQRLADASEIPLGTISRIKAGDNADCRYHTIRKLLVSVIGGISGEFPCNEKMEQHFQRMEELEKQAAKVNMLEKENEEKKVRLDQLLTQIDRLRQEIDYLRIENDRKARIIDKFLDR